MQCGAYRFKVLPDAISNAKGSLKAGSVHLILIDWFSMLGNKVEKLTTPIHTVSK